MCGTIQVQCRPTAAMISYTLSIVMSMRSSWAPGGSEHNLFCASLEASASLSDS